jgi:hypothetical protein
MSPIVDLNIITVGKIKLLIHKHKLIPDTWLLSQVQFGIVNYPLNTKNWTIAVKRSVLLSQYLLNIKIKEYKELKSNMQENIHQVNEYVNNVV